MSDNQKWLAGATATVIIQVFVMATAWGKLTVTVSNLQNEVTTLRQSCISKEVYQTDMKWIDAVTDAYYSEVKKK